jgi:hypothetical protein
MRKATRFEELFLPYLDAAYNLARWMVSRDQDAADIVQEEGGVRSNRVRDNQSATQVNTIRPDKLVSLLAKGKEKE